MKLVKILVFPRPIGYILTSSISSKIGTIAPYVFFSNFLIF